MENFSDDEDEEYQEREDEKPQVVQLRDGDLTEEEAARLAKGKNFLQQLLDMILQNYLQGPRTKEFP